MGLNKKLWPSNQKQASPFSKIAEQFAVRKETPSIKVSPDVFNELWGGVHLGSVYSLWGEGRMWKIHHPHHPDNTLHVKTRVSKEPSLMWRKQSTNHSRSALEFREFVESGDLIILTCSDFKEFEEIVMALPESGLSFFVADSNVNNTSLCQSGTNR